MRRLALAVALATLFVVSLVSSAPAAETRSRLTYALKGEGRGLELALGNQGVTLGLALAQADSTPRALGVGAGQCAVLSDDPDPETVPCTDGSTVRSDTSGDKGSKQARCAGPALPDQLKSVLTVDIACGSSLSSLLGTKLPVTSNQGKVAEVGVGLDLSALVPQAEDAKEQLINELQKIIDQAPEEVRNAVNQLLDTVDEGQAVQIVAGPATSNVQVAGQNLRVDSTAAGAQIGVVGIPDLDTKGNPIAGSARAIEDGLLIIEVGRANASAQVNKQNVASQATASAALVTVKVRDITKTKPTYAEISVAPGQTVTVLEGTPAESTVSAAAASTKESKGSAVAAADAVRLHLLKGVEGGLKVGLGRATAAVSGERVTQEVQPKTAPRVLPRTGGTNLVPFAIGLIVAAGVVYGLRRRFTH